VRPTLWGTLTLTLAARDIWYARRSNGGETEKSTW
jgi:hypothetical protein